MSDGVVIQAQSTAFARYGQTMQQRGFSLPTSLAGSITSAYLNAGVWTGLAAREAQTLARILDEDPLVIPGGVTLYNTQAISPEAFAGAGRLYDIYNQSPFSIEWELETNALYERTFLKARAAAQSGPANVRGGTERQALELAELSTLMSINRFREIWQTKVAMASLVLNAAQLANAAETSRRQLQLRAQQQQAATEQGRYAIQLAALDHLSRLRQDHIKALAGGAEFLGLPVMLTQEAYQGMGANQGATATAFGVSYWR